MKVGEVSSSKSASVCLKTTQPVNFDSIVKKHTKYRLQAHQFVHHTFDPQLLKYEAGVLPTQVMQLIVNNMYYLISRKILIHQKKTVQL
jgi:hypothetical protein